MDVINYILSKKLKKYVDDSVGYVTPEMFGAYGDGDSKTPHNDSPYIQAMADYAIKNKCNVKFLGKTYLLENSVEFNMPHDNTEGIIISGAGRWKTIIKYTGTDSAFKVGNFLRSKIEDMLFSTPNGYAIDVGYDSICHLSSIERVNVKDGSGFLLRKCRYMSVTDCALSIDRTKENQYCVKLLDDNEYVYFTNVYLEGAGSTNYNTGLFINHVFNLIINNCDICNFYNGDAIYFYEKHTQKGVKIENTTFVRDKICLNIHTDIYTGNITVLNCQVSDTQDIDTIFINSERSSGTTGMLGSVYFDLNYERISGSGVATEFIKGDTYWGIKGFIDTPSGNKMPKVPRRLPVYLKNPEASYKSTGGVTTNSGTLFKYNGLFPAINVDGKQETLFPDFEVIRANGTIPSDIKYTWVENIDDGYTALTFSTASTSVYFIGYVIIKYKNMM